MGGRPDVDQMRARGALTLPMAAGARARYTLSLRDVRVSAGGPNGTAFRSLKLPISTYAPTLVDSGTTFVYASTPLYKAIHAHVKQHTPSLTREGGKVCAFLTPEQLAAMPRIQLAFMTESNRPLLVLPEQCARANPSFSLRPPPSLPSTTHFSSLPRVLSRHGRHGRVPKVVLLASTAWGEALLCSRLRQSARRHGHRRLHYAPA
jgi:hypothetical protein